MSQVRICDWCKKQISEVKATINLIFQLNDGKKKQPKDVSYDLCDKCTKEIKKRFESPMIPAAVPLQPVPLDVPSQEVSDDPSTRKEWIEKVESGEVSPDRPLAGEAPVTKKGRSVASKKEGVIEATETNPECPHYNKSQIVIPKDGSRPYQKCRECGGLLEYSKKELDMSTPKGVAFHDKD